MLIAELLFHHAVLLIQLLGKEKGKKDAELGQSRQVKTLCALTFSSAANTVIVICTCILSSTPILPEWRCIQCSLDQT